MLSISSGHSADYLTEAVAKGRENYYTGAVAAGEPPGRWYGAGAGRLGLSGLVDHQDMQALYECFVDPRDPAFKRPAEWGQAATLGHTGRRYLSEQQVYKALVDAEPNATPERRDELRLEAGRKARRNVAFLDATFSVQKSVTVLHTAFEAQQVTAERAAHSAAERARSVADRAGAEHWRRQAEQARTEARSWATHKQAVEDAIWAGNRAALDYLADKAGYSRIGHHGGAAGRFIDAHDWTIASFFQHDNRDHDPQLHIHNAILNRVEGADGKWRTLDGRALYAYRGAAAAVGERTMEEHLARSLGVRFATRPDGKAREVVGVPAKVMDLFSGRRRAVTRKTARLVVAFEAKFGRAPNSLELDRLQRQATFATRKAKSHHGETAEQRLERWDRELRTEVAGGLAAVAHGVLAQAGQAPASQRWSPTAVIETALAAVQAKKAAWTEPDLTREISHALPDHIGCSDGRSVARTLDTLTAEGVKAAVCLDQDRPGIAALPPELRLADGRSAYEAPGRRRYATPEHIHTERALAASTVQLGAPVLDRARANQFVASLAEVGIELGADQAAAVRGVLTSGARIESLVGPAGTGKSFVVGALAKAWQDTTLWGGRARRVVGLAASQIATEVLAGEGLTASNIARWLGVQHRLADGSTHDADQQWRLGAGDLVVVDESAMADTNALAAIGQHAAAAGAKVLLTGDHRQLAAVGAGGGMELMANAGHRYELAEPRRFTTEWERAASLRLRDGDSTVLGEYHKHGRLLDGGTTEQAEQSAARAWLADTLHGLRSLLIVDTNEQAARLSAAVRADLVRYGKVSDDGQVRLGLQDTYASVGDLIQARRNGWHLTGYDGNRTVPINRRTYRVQATRADGGLVAAPVLGHTNDGEQLGEPITLPPDYVTEHVALGYATTVHAAQGTTVDTSHTVVTATTGPEALYVGLSRGRHANTAHVTTRALPADAPTGATHTAEHHTPLAVLDKVLQASDPEQSALATATESAAEAQSVRTPGELLADAAELATAGRTTQWLDQLVDAGHLTDQQRAQIAAEDGATTLTRVLRRAEVAGHDPLQVLTRAATSRPLRDARQLTNVLHHRIVGAVSLEPTGDTHADWTPHLNNPQWQRYLDTLADTADQRRHELGDQLANNPPHWAVDALGPVPEDSDQLASWQRRAGIVAAHRELTGHQDETTPLGPAPKPGQVEAYASWRAAWRALGRPDAGRDELEMSNGQLRMRVRAYQREATWAPDAVAHELAGTTQAAAKHRRTAVLRSAEAAATDAPAIRAQLDREATEARALADTLDQRAGQLQHADQARAQWYAHTAETRAAAMRAEAELAARQTDQPDDGEQLVTAEEWLATHTADILAEDPHRRVTHEHELTDLADRRAADTAAVDTDDQADAVETAVPDIRDTTTDEQPRAEDTVRVPTAEETADSVQRAQRALAEVHARQAIEEQRATDETRAAQLAHWHADDQTTEHEQERELADSSTH